MYWNEDKTTVGADEFLARLDAALAGQRWIIDGNYMSTMHKRVERCDTVIFLDYPTEVCLLGVAERRGRVRDDMPWVEDEPDEEFLAFIKAFSTDTRPKILSLLSEYEGKREIHIFTDRASAMEFLKKISKST